MTPNDQALWNLGNEVVRLRRLSIDLEDSHLVMMVRDMLELINEIRLLSYSKSSYSKRTELPHHHCSQNDYTCHFLGKAFTLTYQKPGTDSDHMLVKRCPFCGYIPDQEYEIWCKLK